MAWIESHQDIAAHPKTRRLARLLGVSVPAAIGHLHLLWWWALSYADDGNLSDFDPDEIAFGAQWEGNADAFSNALHSAGWFDLSDEGETTLHDWNEYAGKMIERRQKNAARMRESRHAETPPTPSPEPQNGRASHVQSTLLARAGATVQDSTVQDKTIPPPPAREEVAEPNEEVADVWATLEELGDAVSHSKKSHERILLSIQQHGRLSPQEVANQYVGWQEAERIRAKTWKQGQGKKPSIYRDHVTAFVNQMASIDARSYISPALLRPAAEERDPRLDMPYDPAILDYVNAKYALQEQRQQRLASS